MCTHVTSQLIQFALPTLAVVLSAAPLSAQVGAADYQQVLLSPSSYMREYCMGPCACPGHTGIGELAGGFTLRYNHSDQWTAYFDVVNVDFTSSTQLEPVVHYTGTGTYEIGGDFAYTHRLTLDLVPLHEPLLVLHHFDSGWQIVTPETDFPSIAIAAATEVMVCTQRTLTLRTAGAVLPACAADVGTQGGVPGRDGVLDNNDFVVFVDAFFNADPIADRGVQGGVPGVDGRFDNNDFVVFIDQFFAGC